MTDIAQTLNDRGKRYGDFGKHASVSQAIKAALFDCRHRDSLPAYQVEALEMIAHKMARIVNGDPFYHDSWHDIAGYATLVADRLEVLAENGPEQRGHAEPGLTPSQRNWPDA